MNRKKGFALPLSLIVLLIISLMAIWAHREVIFDIWATLSHKQSLIEFSAAEAGIRWAVATYVETGVVDVLDENNREKNIIISLPFGDKNIPLHITISFWRISQNCSFKSRCCREFIIRSQVRDDGPLVKVVVVKDIPNPENDEFARKVCIM